MRIIRYSVPVLCAVGLMVGSLTLAVQAANLDPDLDPVPLDLPWKEAGLDERQAAAHLLDRLGYGPRPGDVDRVVAMGLETWVARQLAVDFSDRDVDKALDFAKSLEMPTRELAETYVGIGVALRLAAEEGVVDPGDLDPAALAAARESGERPDGDPATRRKFFAWAKEKGFRPQRDAIGEAMVQKLVRATYSPNQLREVLVDFFFDHFNVSITDNVARIYVWPYERDAIRPHVLGDFRDMLGATARHPAMLHYLDNVRSVADEGAPTTIDARLDEVRSRGRMGRRMADRMADRMARNRGDEDRPPGFERPTGLNENYARELLELHTLGVDGGYTQDDVVEVARAFTGWAAIPPGPPREDIERRLAQAKRHSRAGFVVEDTFVFRADSHDAGEKTILGRSFPAGRGIEDGEEVLDLLAVHPSTAAHLAEKLARRFVADEPPAALVDRLAATWLDTGGDLRAVMVALVESPEFWSEATRHSKIKSPFALAVSALRATDARLEDPRALLDWISRMGQPLYAYQAPTGYPDRADHWVNTGALLHRMNFGLQLATGRVAGVRLDLPSLVDGREPESLDDALATYLEILLPERDSEATLTRLEPMVRDPELAKKIAAAAPESTLDPATRDALADDWEPSLVPGMPGGRGGAFGRTPAPVEVDDGPVAHVVGVILGSPEFQRR